MSEPIEIPFQQLSADALQGVIESFITREGTDYGVHEYTLEQKVEQLKQQLEQGRAVVVFDPVTETCTLLAKD